MSYWFRIRIHGSMPLTNGSGSCYFLLTIFSAYDCLKLHFYNFSKIKSQKESQNGGIKVFLTIFAWWWKEPDPGGQRLVDPDPDSDPDPQHWFYAPTTKDRYCWWEGGWGGIWPNRILYNEWKVSLWYRTAWLSFYFPNTDTAESVVKPVEPCSWSGQ
jgi:hypothetical protein